VKSALVTGAAGFIGSRIAARLVGDGYQVYVCDTFNDVLYGAGEKKERMQSLMLLPNVTVLDLDITNFETSSLPRVDCVINSAAIPGLDPSWSNVREYFEINAFGPQNLLKGFMELGLKPKFIQLSTSSVYGISAIGDESNVLAPSSPYGVSKLGGEQLLRIQSEIAGVQLIVLRLFSVYGPGQRPDMAIRKFISSIVQEKTLSLTDGGEHTRSFTFIEDVVDAVVQSMSYRGEESIFNIGGNETISIRELVKVLEELINKKANIVHIPARNGDQVDTKSNSGLALSHLGFRPKVGLEVGLQKQVNWQIENHI
jgi:nucleoside-diphosphate-sugar epimerase